MIDKVMRGFEVNSSDPELRTMDFLIQAMDYFEKDHRDLALDGDVDAAKERISKWFSARYLCG